MSKRKELRLKPKEQHKFQQLENQNGDLGYVISDIEDLMNEKLNFDSAPPKPLSRKLRAKTLRVCKGVNKLWDALYALQDAQEQLERACEKVEIG